MDGVGVPGRLFGSLARLAVSMLAVFGSLPPALAADGGEGFRILYFEPLTPLPGSQLAPAQQKESASALPVRILSFDAYGRRFDLGLKPNAKVMQDPEGTAIAYRGELTNQPGSWTRLTRIGDELHGLVWDGSELYVIEPASLAGEFTVAPLAPGQGGNLIYRLSDTLVDLGANFCSSLEAAPDDTTDGLTAFKSATEDLKSHTVLQQAAGATLGLRLSVLGDASLRARYATEAELRDALLVRLNNIDGIFSAQLGVEIQVTSLGLYDDDSDPFSNTTVPNTLLNELGDLRFNTPALRSDGLTHLFTGRNLDGNTVGIGYIDALCRNRYGAGLTETRGRGATIESLIAAHEIGHNFGALHDGTGECAATPSNQFIMGPQAVAENDTFSACSLGVMNRSIDRATCVTALPPADVSAALAPVPATLTTGQTFTWSATVSNGGGQQATGVTFELMLPAGISVDEATVAGGSCTIGAGTVQCALGELAVSDSRTVGLVLRAQSSGLFAIAATATATNDPNPANNTATATLAVDAMAPATGNPTATTTSSAGGGGGGGGAMQLLALISLGLTALLRRRPALG